jgi:hypothetical protein
MNHLRVFIFTLTALVLQTECFSQDHEIVPHNKIALTQFASLKSSGNAFEYNYVLTNGGSAVQSVWRFELILVQIDSLKVLKAPADWEHFVFPKHNTLEWSAIPMDTIEGYIAPIGSGQTLSGFSFLSSGLPGIVAYYAEGDGPTPYFDEGQATDEPIPGYDDLTPYGPGVVGRTIGPVLPPSPFVPLNFLDTLTSYTAQSRSLGWIKDQATADKYSGYFASAKTSLQQNNASAARSTLQRVLQDANVDSTSNLTSEAYALIRYNTEYLLTQLPTSHPGFIIKLINSTGTRLTTGSLQYYEGSWKDATNNNDGTFTISSTAKALSLRMTYEYGTQTKSNVTVGSDTAVFQTVNTQIKLQDSRGNPIDAGTVQYYAGAWRSLGTTTNGDAAKELLPNNYTFRMTYASGSNDKAQDIGVNPTVVFQTVNAAVQLQNSLGSLIDTGTVQYYAGAWRSFGVTSSGVATKELLPNNYSFRMTYAYGSNDKQQNIGTNPTVIFQTVNATVQLKNSQGNLIDQGTVQYYAGAWRSFGTTSGGVTTKELLPANYTFRMTYESVSNDKAQDISTNSTVAFSTVLCTISVKDSQGQPVNNVQTSYYSGAWRQIGSTVNGQVTKELLPVNLSFRITYGTNHQDKTQNLSTSSLVEFTTP